MNSTAKMGCLSKKILTISLLIYATWANATDGILASTALCSLSAHTCVDSTPCKTSNGITVCLNGVTLPDAYSINTTETCWEYQDSYSCLVKSSDCSSLETNPLCTENSGSPVCAHTDSILGCDMNTHTYSCQVTAATTTQTQTCTETSTTGGLSWSTSSAPSSADLGKAAAMMEARREVGVYSSDGISIFAGKVMTGTKGYLGLKNCLKTSGGAQSNSSVAKSLGYQVAGSAVSSAAQYGVQIGANAVYDSFFYSGSQMASGFAQWAGMSAPSAGFGFAGFGTTASSAGFGGVGSMAITNAAGETVFYFNPYAFAAMIAIQVVMEMTKCTEDEQTLSQMRGANLCQQVGSYCSLELNLGFAKICIETTESFCCFNGLLPLAVNQQGRTQIGKSWGTAQSPDCSGFTIAQLTALDWSAIDLSAVVTQMQANYNVPSSSQFSNAATGNLKSTGRSE